MIKAIIFDLGGVLFTNKLILGKTGTKPEETIFIDDNSKNLIPAKELGLETLLLKTPDKLRNDLSKIL